MNTKFFGIMIVLAIFLTIGIGTVSAVNPVDEDTISDKQFYLVTSYDTQMAAPGQFIGSLYFNKIEDITNFKSLVYMVNYSVPGSPSYSITRKPGSNTSSQFVTLWDSTSNQYLGSGQYSYYIDNNNNMALSIYVPGGWNLGSLTGTRAINISVDIGTNHCFYGYVGCPDAWYVSADRYLPNTDPDATRTDIAFFGLGLADHLMPANIRYTNYDQEMRVHYLRIPNMGFGASDIWVFYRQFGTERFQSNITLSYWANNTYIPLFSEIGVNDTPFIYVPNSKNVRLELINPVTGNSRELYWLFDLAAAVDILLGKGGASNYPLNPGESTSATALFAGDSSQIGRVIWSWTAGSSTDGNAVNVTEFAFNKNTGTWQAGGAGNYDFETQVLRIKPGFMYADTDANMTAKYTFNSIKLALYDSLGNELGFIQKRVYVGAPATAYTRYQIWGVNSAGQMSIMPNAQLYVHDSTTGTELSTGEIISTGTKLNVTTLGHSFVAWAILGNNTQTMYAYVIDPSIVTSTINGKYANFTVSRYGTSYLNLYLSNKAGTGNASITFYVTDETGTPVEGALVHPSRTASGKTNGAGIATFTNLINGTTAEYIVSKSGWNTVSQNYEIYDGEFIPVILGLVTPTVTATTVVTTTTPIPGPTQPADITDIFGQIGYWLQLIGVPLGQLNLFGALVVIGTTTFAPMYLISTHGGGPATGVSGIVGMVLGFIFSAMIGFISMLWVAIVMVICAVIFAALIWQRGGGS
jgi:hypothetical protein